MDDPEEIRRQAERWHREVRDPSVRQTPERQTRFVNDAGDAVEPVYTPADLAAGAVDPTKFTHVEWVDGKVHETGFTTTFGPNTPVIVGGYDVDFLSAPESNSADTFAAVTSRSYHSGGVTILLMDGSVRFVRNTISQATWRALGTRAGNEVVGDY